MGRATPALENAAGLRAAVAAVRLEQHIHIRVADIMHEDLYAGSSGYAALEFGPRRFGWQSTAAPPRRTPRRRRTRGGEAGRGSLCGPTPHRRPPTQTQHTVPIPNSYYKYPWVQ